MKQCGAMNIFVSPRSEQQMQIFRDALSTCNLSDLGFHGMPHTCDNRQQGRKNASVRLDRAVADQSWRDVFGQATVHHLVSSRSDHCPILIRMQKEVWQPRQGKPMRYEIVWEREE